MRDRAKLIRASLTSLTSIMFQVCPHRVQTRRGQTCLRNLRKNSCSEQRDPANPGARYRIGVHAARPRADTLTQDLTPQASDGSGQTGDRRVPGEEWL